MIDEVDLNSLSVQMDGGDARGKTDKERGDERVIGEGGRMGDE